MYEQMDAVVQYQDELAWFWIKETKWDSLVKSAAADNIPKDWQKCMTYVTTNK